MNARAVLERRFLSDHPLHAHANVSSPKSSVNLDSVSDAGCTPPGSLRPPLVTPPAPPGEQQ